MMRSKTYIVRIICLALFAGSLSACSLFRRKDESSPAGTPAAVTAAPENDVELPEIEIEDEPEGKETAGPSPVPENGMTPAPVSPPPETVPEPSAQPEQPTQPSAVPEPAPDPETTPGPAPTPDENGITVTESGDIELPELP